MVSPRWWLGWATLAWLAVAACGLADPSRPPGDAKAPPRPGEESILPSPEEPKPASPSTVTLTQKEYQDLLDKIARLESHPDSPSRCKVAGRIGGDKAELVIDFEFRTYQARARVALGCAQGFPSKVDLDGRPTLLRWGPNGLFVQVEDVGDHKLVLNMELPLLSRDRPGERGFNLNLPAAPTTTLESLELPAWVTKVQGQLTLRDGPAGRQDTQETYRTVPSTSLGPQTCRLKTAGLGPVERLELTWEGQPPVEGARPLLTVEKSKITVRVDHEHVTTQAELTLGVRRGQTKQWQMLVPPQAVVRSADNDERIEAIETSGPQGWLRTIRLKRETAEPLALTILVEERKKPPVSIGPFVVVGAIPQRGDLLITAPVDMALTYRARGEAHYGLAERELTVDEKRRCPMALAFRYEILAPSEKEGPPPFLDLDTGRGVVETTVSHVLRLEDTEPSRPPVWRLRTTIEATAFHTDLEQLLLQMPSDFEFDTKFGLAPAGEVQNLEWFNSNKRIAQVTFTPRDRSAAPDKPGKSGAPRIILEGRYSPVAGTHQAALELPFPLSMPDRGCQVLDRGCKVTVSVPEDQELVAPHPGPLWDTSKREGHNRRTWILDRQPDQFEIAWQSYRPDLVVDGQVRLTLAGRQARIRHELWLPPGQILSGPFSLQEPEQVNNFKVVSPPEAATLTSSSPPGGGDGRVRRDRSRLVPLSVSPDRDHPLILEYSVALTPDGPGANQFTIPLVVPEQATRGETRVLVWTDPGTCPEVVEGRWEKRFEEVKGVERFPALILLAHRPEPPLTLQMSEAAGPSLPAFRVQKALIQVTVEDNGQQSYRARYLLTHVGTPFLDVELPAALFQPNPPGVKVFYRGSEAPWQPIGRETSLSKVARVSLEPGPPARPAFCRSIMS